ncbi:MAG: hypothetical protein EAZ78_28200 [Oscillatoriales cyanobacterium]|nr:MAG: hypothetical protein EAZ78_28200 [Oscillatoriales cyanobacterium]
MYSTFSEGKDMKIRESVGQSVWNHSEGWCCEPLDPIPPGHIALGRVFLPDPSDPDPPRIPRIVAGTKELLSPPFCPSR